MKKRLILFATITGLLLSGWIAILVIASQAKPADALQHTTWGCIKACGGDAQCMSECGGKGNG